MEMKKESNILTEEKPKYIISLKKRWDGNPKGTQTEQ